jgi:molybdate transport system permease protein
MDWQAMDWQALALTLKLAALTTAILLCITVPLAAWLTLGRSRLRVLIEALSGLPLVLPPLAFSFAGLAVGSVIYSFPFALQPIVAGFAAVDPALMDAARLLGAQTPRLLRTILIPLAARSLMTAAILSFLHTLGEFGVVLMLGGDIPGSTRTLSIVLFNQVEAFDYPSANRTAILLLIFCVIALTAVYARPSRLVSRLVDEKREARRA